MVEVDFPVGLGAGDHSAQEGGGVEAEREGRHHAGVASREPPGKRGGGVRSARAREADPSGESSSRRIRLRSAISIRCSRG